METANPKLFKVGGSTDSMKLSIGITAELKKDNEMRVSFVGATAGFAASKALAMVNQKLALEGKELWIRPDFEYQEKKQPTDANIVAINYDLKVIE